MAYIPYSPEIGAFYTLTGPDGTLATFNNPTDPNYVGMLTDITGLDSAGIRESADVMTQTDGGWHGNFWYDRRPITMSGTVFGIANSDARTTRLDKLRRASNAMRQDAVLSWINEGVNVVQMQTWVRRQQPVRITGGWNKDFQVLLVSQFAPLFSSTLHQIGSYNMISNPSFETNTLGWGTVASARVATGATLSRVTTQHQSGVAAMQITTTATSLEGADFTGVSVVAGTTYTFSIYAKGNAGGEVVQAVVGDATVGTATSSNATLSSIAWTRISVTFTPTASGTTGFAIRQTGAAIQTFFVDAAMLTIGATLQGYYDVSTTSLTIENQGDYPSYPTISILGSSTNPVITNTTTGAVLKFLSGYTIAAGSTVIVDTLNHTAILNGATSNTGSIDFVNTTWPTLFSGNNTFTIAGGGTFTLGWRDCWT